MYSLLVNTEQGLLLFLLIVSLVAANKASKLIYSSSEKLLHRKTRSLRRWSVAAVALALAVIAADLALAAVTRPVFWLDRLLLHAPLSALAALMIALVAMPRLRMLLQRTAARKDHSLDIARRRHAADPALVASCKIAALAAVGALYFAWSPPVPFNWLEAVMPLTVLAFAGSLLWMGQSRRSQQATGTDGPIVYRPWRRRLRLTGTLGAALVVASVPILIAMENSRLPARLSMMAGRADYGVAPRATAEPASDNAAGAAGTSGRIAATYTVRPISADNAPSAANPDVAIAAAGAAAPGSSSSGTRRSTGLQAHRHDGATPSLAAVPVTALTGPAEGEPDRTFTLVAKRANARLSSGKEIAAWTYNGEIPGPELRMKKGELVEVTLYNEDIEDGATLHWHGLDVPNAEDGVAGATQDAVMPGESHTYRFIAGQVGTFWYHSHQHSKKAVEQGLFGALIVEPADTALPGNAASSAVAAGAAGAGNAPDAHEDVTVMTHAWPGAGLAIGADDRLQRRIVAPGTRIKLRLLNTDNWTRRGYQLVGAPFKVTAIDGEQLQGPGEMNHVLLKLTTGGRYDIEFIMPDNPVYLSIDGSRELGILFASDGAAAVPEVPRPAGEFDPIHYGTSAETPFGKDSAFDREFTMVLDNRLAFYNGVPAFYDTINGNVFPNTPMFVVREDELVKVTIANRGAVDHPMHLHGHHMLVLSKNGEAATGSPWWSDTLDVMPGDLYEVAFRADNPGLWMDHCHNLQHAAAGMTMHLMYEGVVSPFEIGTATHNHPE